MMRQRVLEPLNYVAVAAALFDFMTAGRMSTIK